MDFINDSLVIGSPRVVQERLGHANIGITLDIYSHVLPGLQEAAVEKFDRIFEADVSKMLTNEGGVECRPYMSRTYDTLIKRYKRFVSEQFLPFHVENRREIPKAKWYNTINL